MEGHAGDVKKWNSGYDGYVDMGEILCMYIYIYVYVYVYIVGEPPACNQTWPAGSHGP